MAHEEHRRAAPASVSCAVVTVSDTRTPETDLSGRLTRELLAAAGHRIAAARIVPDDPEEVRRVLLDLLGDEGVDAVLLNGGTGIAPRDRTLEAVAALLERTIDGFGEIFRHLSYQEIGPAAMLSRATAGIARGRVVFSMPGSPGAVRLALEKLILPEIAHAVGEARKR